MLQGWADYLRTAPDELTSIVNFANPFLGGPEAPVEVLVAFDGDDAELAAEAIDPIRRLGTVIDDDVALTPYADMLEEGAIPPPGIQFVTRSAFVEEESVPEVLQILAEAGASERSPVIALRSVGGAVSRVPDDATAYAHRQAELMFVTTTVGPAPAIEAGRPALDAIWERLAPHVNGAYANFLTSATEDGRRRGLPGGDLSAAGRGQARVRPRQPVRPQPQRPAVGQVTVRISFLLTNSSMPKRPSSRPKPERFTPPNGSSTPSAPTPLTKTMPASIWSATRAACSGSVV